MNRAKPPGKPGTLYLIGTPIGNLEDVTHRALRILKEADIIAAEDTRVTRRLLDRYGIRTPLVSYHEHSRRQRLEALVAMAREGKQVALVSEAGMPGISDPGAHLVRAYVEAQIPVVVVPGPTAVSAALAVSGFPAQHYVFLGFLPGRSAARREVLRRAAASLTGPIICFEAPHRLRKSLEDMCAVLGDRQAMCARELTKRFEEVVRGTISDLIAHFSQHEPRGEMTVVLAGAPAAQAEADMSQALGEVRELVNAGLPASRAVAHVAKRAKMPRRDLYRAYLEAQEKRE